jgi:hypothetical protein
LEGIFVAEEKHSYSGLFLHDLLLANDNSKKRGCVVMSVRDRQRRESRSYRRFVTGIAADVLWQMNHALSHRRVGSVKTLLLA